MKIFAIILNYRNANQTATCLDSLAGQRLDTVFVVDNSADEFAANELRTVMLRCAEGADYNLRLLCPGANLGFARGINWALNEVATLDCDAYLLINNDAVAQAGMVDRLASALADTGIMMVAPSVVDAAGRLLPMFWYQRFFGLLTTRQLPGSFSYLSGCCLLVRRGMLEDGKLFDEDFFMYGEDTFLGWRAAQDGKNSRGIADAFVTHAGTGASRRGQLFYEYHMTRAHILLALKTWRHPWEIPLLLLSKAGVLFVRAVWRSLRFQNIVPFKAYFMAWRALNVRVP